MVKRLITAQMLQEEVDNALPEVMLHRGPGNTFILKSPNPSKNPNLSFPDMTIDHHVFFGIIRPTFDTIHSIQNVFLKKTTMSLRLPQQTLDQLMKHAIPTSPQHFQNSLNKDYATDADQQRSIMTGSRV
jgi:hypothetical protein